MINLIVTAVVGIAAACLATVSHAQSPTQGEVEIVRKDGRVLACQMGTLNIEGDQTAAHNPGGNVAVHRGSDNIRIRRRCVNLGIDMHSSPGARELFQRDIGPIIKTAIDGGCKLPNIFVGREVAYQSGGAGSRQLQHTEGGRNIDIRHSCADIAVKIREPARVPAGALVTRDGFLIPDGRDYRQQHRDPIFQEWVQTTTHYEGGHVHSNYGHDYAHPHNYHN